MFQGSGKTLAFGIPLIHYILERKEHLEKVENEPVSDFGLELEDISDQLMDKVEDTGDDGIGSITGLGEVGDDEEEEDGEDDSASDAGSDNIVSGMDFDDDDDDDIDVEDNDGDNDGSSSEDEQLEELAVG